jgi:general secretion pathway protein E
LLGFEPGAVVYEPRGCEQCGQTGFKGRIGVFEAVRVDAAVRRLINANADEAEIAREAFAGAPNLGAAARALVLAGETTPEEAIRVSRREEPGTDA